MRNIHSKIIFFIKVLFIAGTCWAMKNFCQKETDGFSVRQILYPSPFNISWETDVTTNDGKENLDEILKQRFTYLASGGQSFAFISEDGNHVLKFFKTPILASFFPLKTWEKQPYLRPLQKFIIKRKRDFGSYKLAFEELKTESGLIYIHLNPTHGHFTPIHIIDKLGIVHSIDLDSTCFVLQKKAELLYPRLERLMGDSDKENAKKTIYKFLQLIYTRYQKGIYDEDPRLHKNIGFLNDEAIFIDIGRFKKDINRTTPLQFKKDLLEITKRFRLWLKLSFPELLPDFDIEINELQKTT